MKNVLVVILIFLSLNAKSQYAQIEIPETYELSNIILALTNYGIADEWEVQKNTTYYKEVLSYFEPVKNHPLLDSVNYSREKWKDYLSFRTDAAAFSFDGNGKLKRDFEFYANEGHNPFDKNLDLINDFISKSGYRQFYNSHQELYRRIVTDYEAYNYVNESLHFLEKNIAHHTGDTGITYKIILSPLVLRMNCHRNLSQNVVADFPSASTGFINGIKDEGSIENRLDSNHGIFTEKDHEYINPITSKYTKLVNTGFKYTFWDKDSGYKGIDSFNEYMTWALYDLFLEEYFPEDAKKRSTYWAYQNASRGFFAHNLFSDKVKELYKKNKNKPFENIYKPLLKWTKKVEKTISQPMLLTTDPDNYIALTTNDVQLEFSEPMNTSLPIGLEIRELNNHRATGNNVFTELHDFKWSEDAKKLSFKITTAYKEFALVFNWWGIEKPLISKKGVFLQPSGYVLFKQ